MQSEILAMCGTFTLHTMGKLIMLTTINAILLDGQAWYCMGILFQKIQLHCTYKVMGNNAKAFLEYSK